MIILNFSTINDQNNAGEDLINLMSIPPSSHPTYILFYKNYAEQMHV